LFRSLFRLFYRPQVTLQELLEEQRNVRSWSATILLVITDVLAMLLLSIFVLHKITDLLRAAGEMPHNRESMLALSSSFVVTMLNVLISALVQYVGGRYVFGWIVQLGLRMVAGREYPRDREERREKAMLLRLVHPYTRWMIVLPKLLSYVALTLMIALTPLPDVHQLSESTAAHLVISLFLSFLIWAILSGIATFSMWIYMIIVRTSAIQKIYRVSVAQAFWGPFLVYAMLYFIAFVVGVIWFFISLSTGDVPQNNLNMM
jgi:hypothetical protein